MTSKATPNDLADRQAVLVIHGIGRQQRFQTLDRFADGLHKVLGGPEPFHVMRAKGEPFEHFVRLEGDRRIDLYEYYWAPETEAKTSFTAVMRWLLGTGLTPIRQLALNLPLVIRRAIQSSRQLDARQGAARQSDRGIWERIKEAPGDALEGSRHAWRWFQAIALWGFFRELLRVLYVTALTLVVVGLVSWLLAEARSVALEETTLEQMAAIAGSLSIDDWLLTVALFGALLLLIALGKSLGRQWRDLRTAGKSETTPDSPDEPGARALFLVVSVGLLLGIGRLCLHLGARLREPASELERTLWVSVGPSGVALVAVVAVMVYFVRRLLKHYVADIALYTTADERSPHVAVRRKILDGAVGGIRWLLDRGYGSVAVAGHSLGSVIAYDAVARLAYEADLPTGNGSAPAGNGSCPDAPADPGLERLRVLITFGSPLNKILYFFRTVVGTEERVRAQVLSRMHGFRRPPDLLTNGRPIRSAVDFGDEVRALDDEPHPLDGLFWLNAYSPRDVVSAPLVFYEAVIDYRRWCGHMGYWKDSKFYEEVAAALERRTRRAKIPPWLEIASRTSGIYHVSASCRYARQIEERNRILGPAARRKRKLHPSCPVVMTPSPAPDPGPAPPPGAVRRQPVAQT